MHNDVLIIRANEHTQTPISHQCEFNKRVILNKHLIPGLLQCATANFDVGEEIKTHVHPTMTEVFYILDGEVNLHSSSKTYHLFRGDTFVVFPSTEHSLTFPNRAELLYFNIESPLSTSQ